MNEVLRQEKKMILSLDEYYRYANYFSKVLFEDPHNHGDGYTIRSLYFDTIDDRDFEEKEDGVELRRKIRLRNYGPDQDFAMLEIKQKEGNRQRKRSLRMSKEDAKALIAGNTSVLLSYSEALAAECYAIMNMHAYRAKTIIEYKRRAFIAQENNIRITFDHHIISSESCMDLFSEDLNQVPVFEQGSVVLEVKYNGFLLSYIKDVINQIDRSETSVSKYCLGRSIAKHYHF